MEHPTTPIKVWADIDLGVVDMVVVLNSIEGVRTIASCQGTIGEGGPRPYPAHVMALWTPEALKEIRRYYDVFPQPDGTWGTVVRRGVVWEDPPEEV